MLHLPRTCGPLQPLRALGIGPKPAQGRHGLPANAGPAGIPRDLGRHHARRRRGRTPQHPSRPGPRWPIASMPSPRSTSSSPRNCSHRWRARALMSPATRRSGCTATPRPIFPHRSRDRWPFRHRRRGLRSSCPVHRGRRALHLHIGHYGSAESGQHKSLPVDACEQRLRRRHGYARQRPHVRLSAALSHSRRRGRDRRAPGPGRLGGDKGQVFRARVLGRYRALGVHLLSIHRRALPLSHQFAAEPE